MKEIQTCFAPARRPVRVLQYGEGNFLRGFADWMIDILNEKGLFDGSIALVKPRPGSMERFRRQHGLYTVCLRGRTEAGVLRENRVITSIGDALSAYEDYAAYAAYARLDTLRFVLSNTTEAGIVYDPDDRLAFEPPRSFPGKLTKLLYERAEHFAYDESRGLIVIPTELTDRNGALLKECVLRLSRDWALGERFERWLNAACVFADTLVDRIVSGYSQPAADELGYRDDLMLVAEPFALWVIGADLSAELPFDRAGLPVVFTRDVRPYKERKVRLLNGAHTSFVPSAFLAGYDIVRDALHDPLFLSFIRATLHAEVIPGLLEGRECGGGRFSEKSGHPPRPLPKSDDLIRMETKEQLECGAGKARENDEIEGQMGREREDQREENVGSREDLLAFAQSVEQRFDNPFVDHRLLAITLNSVSKWRGRCMPSLLRYQALTGRIAPHLAFSLAALMAFDQPESREEGALIGLRAGQPYRILDEEAVLAFFWAHRADDAPALTHAFLAQEAFWERDLTLVPGLEAYVAEALADIRTLGVRKALEKRFA